MDLKEVLANLCSYDKRNIENNYLLGDLLPSGKYEYERDYSKDCFCDNCFYGRHELVEEILRLKSKGK